MDKRKFNKGTIGNKGGRPPREQEIELIKKLSPLDTLAYNALESGIRRGEYKYLQLFFNYRYGKAKDVKGYSIETEKPLFYIKDEIEEPQQEQQMSQLL